MQDIMNWITANPAWSGVAIFLIAFLESLVILGIFLPGILILFGVGALVGLGVADLATAWIGGSLGAFCGDFLSFWVGHRYRNHLKAFWPFSRYPGLLQRGTEFFRRHGAKGVVAGRFIGPLRPVLPATAGMLGMPTRAFLLVCIPACMLWTPAYLLPGMLFGASLEMVADYAGRLSAVAALAVLVVWGSLWLIRTVYELSVVYSARTLRHAIRWTRRHPVLGRLLGPIIDPSQPEALSVATLGLLLVLTLCALLVLQFLAPFGSQPGSRDLAVLAVMKGLRNEFADPLMVAVSQLSRWWVLLPTALATLLWLLGAQRHKAALHWLAAMVGGAILHLIMTWTLRSMPILGPAPEELSFLPSAPMTMATVVLGFFAVMVARELRRSHRRWPYMATTLLLSSLLFARIYLGLDWLSGALVGCILGLAWTAIVGMAYRARALRPFSGAMASAIFYTTLGATLGWQVLVHLDQDLEAVQLPMEERRLSMEDWWSREWTGLPRARTVSRSIAAREFNLQLAGDGDALRNALAPDGWEPVERAGWRWLLQSLNPEADAFSLPLTGKNHLGRRETLVLRQVGGVAGRQRVLRLWDSGVRLSPDGTPVLVGQFFEERLTRRLWLFSYWRAEPLGDGELERLARRLRDTDLEARLPRDGLLLIRRSERTESGAGSRESTAGAAGDPAFPAAPVFRRFPGAAVR
jgi:membrane protein DedA with SNARE-associated domain